MIYPKIILLALVLSVSNSATASNIEACLEQKCVDYFNKWKVLASRKITLASSVMGELYYQGYGTEKDLSKSLKYFRRAAKYQFTYAQYRTGLFYLYEKDFIDYDDGVKYLKKAARRGHGESAFILALGYGSGEFGDKDIEESDKWLEKAILAKNSKAQGYANFLHKNNKIQHKDYPKISTMIADLTVATPSETTASTQVTLEEKNEIQWPEDSDTEVITVSAPSVEDVFDDAIQELKNNPPKSAGTTGTRIIGKSCEDLISCNSTDLADMERLMIQTMGMNLNHMRGS